MKRHPALQNLSRDHHLVLYHCQRLRRALARAAPWPELRTLLKDVLAFYETDLKPHFQEEDELVVPAAQDAGDARLQAIGATVGREHHDFRRRLEALDNSRDSEASVRVLLADLEPKITNHVQREETELFEGLQTALPEHRLRQLWRQSYEFRRAHRSPAACGRRPRP